MSLHLYWILVNVGTICKVYTEMLWKKCKCKNFFFILTVPYIYREKIIVISILTKIFVLIFLFINNKKKINIM